MSLYNALLLSLLLLSCADPNPYGTACVSTRGVTYLTPAPELLSFYGMELQWTCDSIQRSEDAAVENIQLYASRVDLRLLRGYTVRYVNTYGWRLADGQIVTGESSWLNRSILIRFGPTCDGVLTHEFLHVVSNYDSWWTCGEVHCDWAARGFYAAAWAPMKCL